MASDTEIVRDISELHREQAETYKRLYEISEGQLALNEKLIAEMENKSAIQDKLIKHLTSIVEQYEIMVAERDELIKRAIR